MGGGCSRARPPAAMVHMIAQLEQQNKDMEATKARTQGMLDAAKRDLAASERTLEEVRRRPQTYAEQVALVFAEHVGTKTMPQLVREAKVELGLDCTNKVNIGIAGDVGVGKSTAIGAALGLSEDQAPEVDIAECTSAPKSFSSPKYPGLCLWDLPGQNTSKFPAATYLTSLRLYAFDALIVMYSPKLSATAVELVKLAAVLSVPIALVRTKADQDLDNILRSNRNMSPADARAMLRDKMKTEIARNFPEQSASSSFRSFVVSMRNWEDGEAQLDELALLDYLKEQTKSCFEPQNP